MRTSGELTVVGNGRTDGSEDERTYERTKGSGEVVSRLKKAIAWLIKGTLDTADMGVIGKLNFKK